MFEHIQWPDGIDQQRFLSEYWQQKPLLIRQALPDFQTPLPADELAGLSLEPDTTPRLILKDASGDYHLEHGPFEAERFDSLTDNNWSLLVTDVEKHVPELATYLRPFSFLPNWRIDDLMISYAPVGASVGAHVDEYDVFLLQASGTRRWSIDVRTSSCVVEDADSASASGDGENPTVDIDNAADLKLISAFEASDTWELAPGDLLYLPPGVPHHGVASGEPCTTWSIGFRAPALNDFAMRIAEMIAESLPARRFRDGQLSNAVPGEITRQALAQFESNWRESMTIDSDLLATLTGQFLTESGEAQAYDAGEPDTLTPLDHQQRRVAPFCKVAWRQPNVSTDFVQLFANGDVFKCSRLLAIQLCSVDALIDSTSADYDERDRHVLAELYNAGCIV